jgi:cytochrome c-type biogenesis protein CcmH/NrfG
MTRKSLEERLTELEREREKLIGDLAGKRAKELRAMERTRAREAERIRKADTSRKILLGAFVLAKIRVEDEHGTTRSWLEKELPAFLTNDRDREILKEFLPGRAP